MTTVAGNSEWGTPQWLFTELDAEFGFILDACATDANAKCGCYFTPEQDGLSRDWGGLGPIWMNPPYARSELPRWLEKASIESQHTTVVGLIPAWTSTKYWHEFVMLHASEIRFVAGRLKFVGPINTRGRHGSKEPRWGSVIIVWRPERTRLSIGRTHYAPVLQRVLTP